MSYKLECVKDLRWRVEVLIENFDYICKYFEYVKEFITKYSNEDVTEWKAARDEFQPLIEKITKTIDILSADENTFEFAFNQINLLYNLLDTIDTNNIRMVTIMGRPVYTDLLRVGISQTFHDEIGRNLAFIKELMYQYNIQCVVQFNEKFLPSTYSMLQVVSNIATAGDIVREITTPNDFIIYVSKRVVFEADASTATVFIDKIEEMKDITLKSTETFTIPKSLPMIQQLIFQHGLIPVCEYMQIQQLFKYQNVEYNNSLGPIENIKMVLGVKYNVMVIHKITKNLVEYKIRPLIDQKYIIENELLTNPRAGINKRTLKRFDTIVGIDVPLPSNKLKETIQFFPSSNNANMIVLECINYKLYRVLSHHIDKITVDVSLYEKMTPGVISARADRYNKIMSEEILSKAIHSRFISAVAKYDPESPPYRFREKSVLVEMIIGYMKKYIRVKNIVSYDIMYEAFTDRQVLLELEFSLTKAMNQHFADIPLTVENKFTYVSFIEHMSRRINHEYDLQVKELFASGKIKKSRFNDMSPDDINAYVMGWFSDIIVSVVDAIDGGSYGLKELEYPLKRHITHSENIKK